MEKSFKYTGGILPPVLCELIDSLIGYSSIDDSPIYKITFDVSPYLIDDIFYNSNDRTNYKEYILLFLRNVKTNYLLKNIKDKELMKFSYFVQYYYDNMDYVIIYP